MSAPKPAPALSPTLATSEIVQAASVASDMADFGELYSAHYRPVFSLCLRMMGNVAEAEDLTQEVFIQLRRKLSSFRGDSAFTTWLHRRHVEIATAQGAHASARVADKEGAMIYIIEHEGKPMGAIRIDEQGATIAFNDEQGRPVVVSAQGSLLPAFVRQS